MNENFLSFFSAKKDCNRLLHGAGDTAVDLRIHVVGAHPETFNHQYDDNGDEQQDEAIFDENLAARAS